MYQPYPPSTWISGSFDFKFDEVTQLHKWLTSRLKTFQAVFASGWEPWRVTKKWEQVVLESTKVKNVVCCLCVRGVCIYELWLVHHMEGLQVPEN